MFALRFNHYEQRQKTSNHQHPDDQLIYIHHGCGIVDVVDGSFILGNNELLWLPGGVNHQFQALKLAKISLLYFVPPHQLNFPKIVTRLSAPLLLSGLLQAYAKLTNQACSEAYQTVILDLLRQAAPIKTSQPAKVDARLVPVIEALYSNPGIHHSLKSVSQTYGPSERTLHRLFEQAFGCAFREWRQQLVMSKAQQWVNEGKSMTFIALELGYKNLSAFSHAYAKWLQRHDPKL